MNYRWQGSGLGTELVQRLIAVARAEKIHRIGAHILTENRAMLRLAQRFHFSLTRDEDPAAELAVLELKGDRA